MTRLEEIASRTVEALRPHQNDGSNQTTAFNIVLAALRAVAPEGGASMSAEEIASEAESKIDETIRKGGYEQDATYRIIHEAITAALAAKDAEPKKQPPITPDLFQTGGDNDLRVYAYDDPTKYRYLVKLEDHRHLEPFIEAANNEVKRLVAAVSIQGSETPLTRDSTSQETGDFNEAEGFRSALSKCIDFAEWGWTIIANAHGGNWELESKDWQDAAAKYRDEFHNTIRFLLGVPRSQSPDEPSPSGISVSELEKLQGELNEQRDLADSADAKNCSHIAELTSELRQLRARHDEAMKCYAEQFALKCDELADSHRREQQMRDIVNRYFGVEAGEDAERSLYLINHLLALPAAQQQPPAAEHKPHCASIRRTFDLEMGRGPYPCDCGAAPSPAQEKPVASVENWSVEKRHDHRFHIKCGDEPVCQGGFSNELMPLQIATAHNLVVAKMRTAALATASAPPAAAQERSE